MTNDDRQSDPWGSVGRSGWDQPGEPSYPPPYPGQTQYPGHVPAAGGFPYPGDAQHPGQLPYPGEPSYPAPTAPPARGPHTQQPYYPPQYQHGGGIPPRPPVGGPPRGGGYLPPPPRRTPGGIIIGRIVAALVALALIVVSGVAWSAVGGKPKNASNATDEAGDIGVVTTDDAGNPLPAGGLNILVVGTDSRSDASGQPLSKKLLKEAGLTWTGGGTLTDTLMIIHVPADGSKATAVSIPRDTWMDESVAGAPGVVGPYNDGTTGPYRANKINSFYGTAKTYQREYLVSQGESDQAKLERQSSEAGRAMLVKVLQQFTGVKIDHYAEVNLIGFYDLSQAIGGVPVCLLNATSDPLSRADFPAGHFEVSGHDALAFVRQRHGLPGGDLDRVRRQQAFLAGAADKILSVGTLTSPTKLSDLVDAANRSLVLDKNFDLLTFGQQLIALSSGNINFTTIPTHGAVPGIGTSALATDPGEVRQLFQNLMTDRAAGPSRAPVKPKDITVDVQNGTETPGMAAQVGAVVAAAGFVRGQLSDYPGVTPDNQEATTTVRYGVGGKAAARKVLQTIGMGELQADDSVDDGHVLVVVGTDMPVGGAPTHSTPPPPDDETDDLPADAINAGDIACIN